MCNLSSKGWLKVKTLVSPRFAIAVAAVALLVGGCAQLAKPEIVEGVGGKKYRIDGYGLEASMTRGDCTPEHTRTITVNLKNPSEDAYVLYEVTDDNLTPKSKNTTGEITPGGTVVVEYIPTDPTKYSSATVVQLMPDGTIARKTTKFQGFEARSCS